MIYKVKRGDEYIPVRPVEEKFNKQTERIELTYKDFNNSTLRLSRDWKKERE